jgi:hypothetical protein
VYCLGTLGLVELGMFRELIHRTDGLHLSFPVLLRGT